MLRISNKVAIPDEEIELAAIRAGGPGGQHVDKAATAVHLRFDVPASSLPDHYKRRLLALEDRRITGDGVVVIKAREHRSRELNEQSARERLRELVRSVATPPRPRKPTRPSRAAKAKRIDEKKQRGRVKRLRKPPVD
ncbi:MAG: alternative ribosome rescue aminoacyl-tRNA hydrolase ArfB [Halofilum sp. (in: g-proteobacteria)]|nr:alternative ribosome rescue aminoacyl-tRNA hydrolase ArfB [Halofilum sp. (in: g-proteobacteria)]